MKTSEIRAAFTQFFASKQHHALPGSSLIPANDPTLLFTNSGMVQFKDVFLGNQQVDYNCATTVQPCIRAGGKHNDLENVGFTARHHTFFEMLGNFSFGAYFKKEAISYAWEFLTQVLKLPPEKLWVTVHYEDEESEDIWFNHIKIDQTRFSRLDEDNFWQMGDTGPCGPCTEIFYDHGAEVPGGPPGSPDGDKDRFIEIWNLVFMQFNKNTQGEMQKLSRPAVDTGMGLERIAAVLQGVHSNYEIDAFVVLLKAIRTLVQEEAGADKTPDLHSPHMHVIADHLRSGCFLITDQILPGNEGRGYVLRRIIRRAVRHGYQLGLNRPFIYKLVDKLVDIMGSAYPQLAAQAKQIKTYLQQEEQQFFVTLNHGMQLLEGHIAKHKLRKDDTISGEIIFKLYDTYGFPVDITSDIARERQLELDMPGFEQAMAKQRERARSQQKFRQDQQFSLHGYPETLFVGYNSLKHQSQVIALFNQQQETVTQLKQGEQGTVLLESTPFYAESGGQIGDTGRITNEAGACFTVEDTRKQGNYHLHHGKVVQGAVVLQDPCHVETAKIERQATARNHSATHLLHAALRQTLGEHVQQKGSLVNSTHLRFDFSHPQPLTVEQIQQINQLVNQQIHLNTAVQTEIMPLEQAKQKGAMALFGEKYADEVRVLTMGRREQEKVFSIEPFSIELCGGTHIGQTGDIQLFHITKETGIASGIRRIEAITGATAYQHLIKQLSCFDTLVQALKTSPDKISERLQQLLQQNKAQQKQLETLQKQIARQNYQQLLSQAEDIGEGIKLLIHQDDKLDNKTARDLIDQLKNSLNKAVICLVSSTENKVSFLVGVSKSLTDKIHAGKLVQHIAAQLDGKGGGRSDLAQGGGNPAKLAQALAGVKSWINQK